MAEIDVTEEHYSDKFPKNITHSNKFLYDKEETYEIDNRNTVFKLPKPQSVKFILSTYINSNWMVVSIMMNVYQFHIFKEASRPVFMH
ncbi:UNVERIFIED_CONTAM: hypothetical protein NCL1_63686 [Trichonephila clavipes]